MRRLVRSLVVLVVLVALAAAADVGAKLYAEHEAADAMSGPLQASPDVDIHGFPFVTQWAQGQYAGATVRAGEVTVAGTTVDDVTLTLADVSAPAYARTRADVLEAKAGSVRMTGTVPYGELPLPGGVTAERQGDEGDRMRVSGDVRALGQRVRFRAVVAVSLHEGRARLKPRKVDFLGPVPSRALTSLVRNNLDVTVDPPGLPPGMEVTSLKVTDDGLHLVATGRDVTLPGS